MSVCVCVCECECECVGRPGSSDQKNPTPNTFMASDLASVCTTVPRGPVAVHVLLMPNTYKLQLTHTHFTHRWPAHPLFHGRHLVLLTTRQVHYCSLTDL